MGKNGENSELGRLIKNQDKLFNAIFDSVRVYAIIHKSELDFRNSAFNKGFITLEDIGVKSTENISILENIVSFDAIIDANFSVKNKYKDYDDEESLWFRVSCQMKVTDKIDEFFVKETSQYLKEKYQESFNSATASFVPIISKKDFDAEAEKFLNKWCPQALATPMPTPMYNIVRNLMNLEVITDTNLTKDLKIFGQICFSDGVIKTYDNSLCKLVDTPVKRGTVFIDPDTFFLRNLGCLNNTLAHEAFHWERHRIYATIRGLLNGEQVVACRCPTSPKGNVLREQLTDDEDWMEWQSNGIAPKILMPKATTVKKIEELSSKYEYVQGSGNYEKLQSIICELAEFFLVSKQAAKIRMVDLGFLEANEVFNYDKEFSYTSNEISLTEANSLYNSSKELKEIIDSQLFQYVEGYFVVNSDMYITEGAEPKLTQFAKDTIEDCSLQFTYDLVALYNQNKANGVMFRDSSEFGEVARYETSEYNENVIRYAKEIAKLQADVMAAQSLHDTACKMICKWMDSKKWNSAIFQEKTFLSAVYYSKPRNMPAKRLELPAMISICMGLGLDIMSSHDLLRRAGHVLVPTEDEDLAYQMLLSDFCGKTIYECNDFLDGYEKSSGKKIRKLGSQEYKSK